LEAERAKQPALPFFTICSQMLRDRRGSPMSYPVDQNGRGEGKKQVGKEEKRPESA
jgi:hypothetical protein